MSNQNNAQSGRDYCKNIYKVSDREVVNTFKCNQRQFSSSDMWQIQKNKREFIRR